jgi:hypothetical protein
MQVAVKRACAHPTAKQVVLMQHADSRMDAVIRLQSRRDAISDATIVTMPSILEAFLGLACREY